jgi:hypothetical protein
MCIICCILCIGLQAPQLVLGAAALATRIAVPAAIAAASLVAGTGGSAVDSVPLPAKPRATVVSNMTRSASQTIASVKASVADAAPAAARPAATQVLYPIKTVKTITERVLKPLP